MQRVVAMAADHVLVDVEEEAGLVVRVDVAVAPDRILELERVHVGLAGDLVDRVRTHALNAPVGRVVVRAGDHRPEDVPVAAGQIAVPHAASVQVRHHQHRLEHARGRVDARVVVAPVAAPGGHREGDDPVAVPRVLLGGPHVGQPRMDAVADLVRRLLRRRGVGLGRVPQL